jgi:hypothetical protein
MARVRWNDFSKGWWPLGPGDDIPQNALRDATGIRPFYGGRSIRSRFGHQAVATVGSGVQSIFIWRGEIFYATGNTPSQLKRLSLAQTTPSTVINNLGGGPLRFAAGIPNPDTDATKFQNGDATHLYVVGGGLTAAGVAWNSSFFPLRKISNAFGVAPMGLDPPQDNFTLGKQDPIIILFDGFELITPWVTSNASTTLSTNRQAGAALQVTVTSEQVGHITRNRSVNWGRVNATFNGVSGTVDSVKQDWIRLWVHCVDPSTVDKIDILVDCAVGSVPADANQGWEQTYSYTAYVADEVTDSTIKPKGVTDTKAGSDKRDPKAPFASGGRGQRPSVAFDDTEEDPDTNALETTDVESAQTAADLAETRLNPSANSWTHLRIPKLLFQASSEIMDSDPATTWSRVRRIRLVVHANEKGNAVVTFDELDLHMGLGIQGDYKIALTAHNSVTGTRSMPTAIKEVKGLLRQGIFINGVTVSGETFSFADEIEIWRTFGNGNVLFYNKPVKYAQILNAQILDFTADYEGLHDPVTLPGIGPMRYLKQKILPEDNVRLSKQTHDICGPYLGRLWSLCLDQPGRVFYSPPGRLEVAQGFVDVSDGTDKLKRIVHWNSVYVLSEKRIFRLITQQEPFLFEEVHGASGTIFVDSVVVSKFGIIYMTSDGVAVFDGVRSVLFSIEAMESFFQNMASPTVSPLDPTAGQSIYNRFALFGMVHEDEYFVSDTVRTIAVNLRTGVWRNLGVGFGPGVSEETFGHLVAITVPLSTGKVSFVEISAQTNDGGTAIPFAIRTSEAKLEDQSGATKIIQRFYVDIDTAGQSLTLAAYYRADGSLKVITSALSTATRQLVEYADCLPCDVLAIGITGNLTSPIAIYEIGADVHLPEKGGENT